MSRHSHERVAKWLTNFSDEHRMTATTLVDALRLVSATEIRTDLGRELRRLLKYLPGPIATFPVREVKPPASAHGTGREGGYDLLPSGLPGSEAIIANILTGISREAAYRGAIVGTLDLSNLRRRRVRTILLVDDFSGSGKRLRDFGKALRRHPTIRSWLSYGWVKMHVVAYAATAEATRLLRSTFGIDNVHLARACPTFQNARWTAEQMADVEALCDAYCGTLHDYKFGFRSSKALIAFEHTAPNNLPAILWRSRGSWKPLFDGKAVPADLLTLYRPDSLLPTPSSMPSSIGGASFERLGEVLQMIDRRVRDEDAIVDATLFRNAFRSGDTLANPARCNRRFRRRGARQQQGADGAQAARRPRSGWDLVGSAELDDRASRPGELGRCLRQRLERRCCARNRTP